MPRRRMMMAGLFAGIAVASVVGPLVFGAIAHRTSDATLNQIVGDLAGLVVVAPTALVASVLLLRGHRAGPLVALAPGAVGRLHVRAADRRSGVPALPATTSASSHCCSRCSSRARR